MPSHPVARAVIRESGLSLAAPSANRSGSPSPTTAAHVLADLDGRIAAVVDGGECSVGVESTVVLLTDGRVRLLRPGGVTPVSYTHLDVYKRQPPILRGEHRGSRGQTEKDQGHDELYLSCQGSAGQHLGPDPF